MRDAIDDVTIVGGGDSGLLTGLAIRQFNPGVDVSVVDDFQQDVPEVGKSTYAKIFDILHGDLDVDEERFVSEVKPVWKCSVYFRDWCGYPAFHAPFDPPAKVPATNTEDAVEHYYHFYDELYDSPDHRTTNEEIVAQGVSPWYFEPGDFSYDKYRPVAYHLDTDRFNSFLRDLCRERGVSLIDDEITAVETSGNRVERVRSKRQAYEADLYVDASGFNRVLKRELDAEFVEFEFPLDAAFNARVERSLADVEPATVVESGEHGWFWQIDTFESRDLGYVFASEYVSEERALAEFLDHCGGAVAEDDVASYEFSSGYYERSWVENALAIGNAEGFVEPLQSTALTTNAWAAVALSNLLSDHGRIDDDWIRESFNGWVRQSWESIRDFIAVHYLYSSGDTEFWQDVQSLPASPRVEHLAREFDRSGFGTHVEPPTKRSDDVEDLRIFQPLDFFLLMLNMGATSEFYEDNRFEVSEEVVQRWEEFYRGISEDVAYHLTVQEFYSSVEGGASGS